DALDAYQEERMTEALRLQNAARNSMTWFENVRRYIHLEPEQFAYSLLTRSQRVSHENLRLRDRRYLEGVERWFASRADVAAVADAAVADAAVADAAGAAAGSAGTANAAGSAATAGNDSGDAAPCPPMFTPFRLRGPTIPNRGVVSPLDMYCAENGTPQDFHLVHLGSRAP